MARLVGLLIFPDFQILDAAGPIAAFEIASRFAPGAYALEILAAQAGLVRSSSGVAMAASALDPEVRFDTLMAAGGAGVGAAAADSRNLAFLTAAAGRARRVASVCSGAFLLAATGLLDGRRATTHWARSVEFTRRFPSARLEADRIFVKDGPVWTSAGISAGVDLALAMIGEDLGDDLARRVAQQMVVYHRRPGGQSQFSALLELDRPDARFGPLVSWARDHLEEPLDVEQLADKAAMSPRHFARAFAAETGVTPAKAVERLRVEAARERLEGGIEPIEAIAVRVGFGDAERMRRAFVRTFGQPPQALRRAAGQAQASLPRAGLRASGGTAA
ncbi:MAG: GlxA family transcriptional regulator [Caulobacteraceae bacterium]|nr:GlxA family transcriptional regulator [Caulobacteraceae bacterium]